MLILVSPNLVTDYSYSSGYKSNQIIATCDLNSGINNFVDNTFYVENPNGKYITFRLQDEFMFDISYTRLNQNTTFSHTQWYLTLEFTPIDEDYQS